MLNCQSHFQDLIEKSFKFKILVNASPNAHQMLCKHGLTPAQFLQPFAFKINQPLKINYRIDKQRFQTSNLSFKLVDYHEFRAPDIQPYNNQTKRIIEYCKPNIQNMNLNLKDNLNEIEQHLNKQTFIWFFQGCKVFIDHTNFFFGINYLDLPYGYIQIMTANQDNIFVNLKRIREQNVSLIKKAYQLNPQDIPNIPSILIILVDESNKEQVQNSSKIMNELINKYSLHSDSIVRLFVNGSNCKNILLWAGFNNSKYYLKIQRQCDQIKLITQQQKQKIYKMMINFLSRVKNNVQQKLDNQMNYYMDKIKGNFFNFRSFFRGEKQQASTMGLNQRCLRYISDILFLSGEYKNAIKFYELSLDELKSKSSYILANALQMKVYSQILLLLHNPKIILQNDLVQIENSFKNIYKNYELYKNRMIKYSIRATIMHIFFIYIFRRFERLYGLNQSYHIIKQYESYSYIVYLIKQHIANFTVLTPSRDFRNYGERLFFLGYKFYDRGFKYHSLRCFREIQNIFDGSIGDIEQHVLLYQTKLLYQCRFFDLTTLSLRKAFNIQYQKMQKHKIIKFASTFNQILQRLLGHVTVVEMIQMSKSIKINYPKILMQRIQIITEDQITHLKKHSQKCQNKLYLDAAYQNMSKDYLSKKVKKKKLQQLIHNLQDYNTIQASQRVYKRVVYLGQKVKFRIVIQNVLSVKFSISELKPITNIKCFQIEEKTFQIQPNQFRTVQFFGQIIATGEIFITGFQWQFNIEQGKNSSYNFIKFDVQQKQNIASNKNYFCFNSLQSSALLQTNIVGVKNQLYEGQVNQFEMVIRNVGQLSAQSVVLLAGDADILGFEMIPVGSIEKNQDKLLRLQLRNLKQKTKEAKMTLVYQTNENYRFKKLYIDFITKPSFQIRQCAIEKFKNTHIFTIQIQNNTQLKCMNQSVNLLQKFAQQRQLIFQAIIIKDRNKKKWNLQKPYSFSVNNRATFSFLFSITQSQNQIFTFNFNEQINQKYQQIATNYLNDHKQKNVAIIWNFNKIIGIHVFKYQDRTNKSLQLPFYSQIQSDDTFIWKQPFVEHKISLIIQNLNNYPIFLQIQLVDADQKLIYQKDITSGFIFQGLKKMSQSFKERQRKVFQFKVIFFQRGKHNVSRIKFFYWTGNEKQILSLEQVKDNKKSMKNYNCYPGQYWIRSMQQDNNIYDEILI